MATSTHPYYLGKAQAAMASAGAPDADVTAIADWAEQHRDDQRAGIVVDSDGQIVADTHRSGDHIRGHVTYLTALRVDVEQPHHLIRAAADLAVAGLSRRLARPLVRLTAGELTTGPRAS